MYSGRFATIDGISNVAKWSIKETVPNEKIVNSATQNGTDRLTGIHEVSGSYEAHGGKPAVMPGAVLNFVGYTSPTTGVKGTAGLRYSVSALVSQVVVTWDFAENKAVKHTVQFQGSGALTVASGTAILDAAAVVKQASKLCPFLYGAAVPLLPTRRSATLTLTDSGGSYSNAGTNNFKVREAGALDWTLAIPADGHEVLMAVDTYLADLKLHVNPTEYWWFNDALVVEATDITLSPSSDSIEAQTVNIAMLASDSAGVVGFARKPGELIVNFWPIA